MIIQENPRRQNGFSHCWLQSKQDERYFYLNLKTIGEKKGLLNEINMLKKTVEFSEDKGQSFVRLKAMITRFQN